MKLSHAGEKIAKERLGMGIATMTRIERAFTLSKVIPPSAETLDELREVTNSMKSLLAHIQGQHQRQQCIYCGCTEDHACMLGGDAPRPCQWWNQDHTCCDNPDCKRRHQAVVDLAAKKAGV